MAGPAYQPYNSAIPGADIYGQADVLATNAYNKALAQINANRMNTLTQYGYRGTVDPTSGVVSGITVDPNNPYGKLQQLFHDQALEDRTAEFAAEDRGLHGGLAHQGLTENRYEHGAQRTDLGSALTSTLSDLASQQTEAANERDAALWQAQYAQLQQAIANGDFNLPDTPDGSGGGGGGTPPGAPGPELPNVSTGLAHDYFALNPVLTPKQKALKRLLGNSRAKLA